MKQSDEYPDHFFLGFFHREIDNRRAQTLTHRHKTKQKSLRSNNDCNID